MVINQLIMNKILFLFIFLLFTSCDVYHQKSAIKMANLSNKEIITYIKDIYSDTVLSINDQNLVKSGIDYNDGLSFSILPNDTAIVSVIEYCNKKIWDNCIKNDTMLLFILDKKLFFKSKNINLSKISLIKINYNYINKCHCLFVYK